MPRRRPIDPLVREITRHRREQGVSQAELAHRAGISIKTLSDAENGRTGLTVHTLRQLTAALDLQIQLKPRRQQTRGLLQNGPRDRDPYIDYIAVERACNGDPVTLTIAERGEVVRRLTARGLSSREIAERIRLAQRSVIRYRAGLVRHANPTAQEAAA